MPELKKIVLTTDFSENATMAESWAVALAKQFHGSIDLVHVFEESIYYFAAMGNIALTNDFSSLLSQAFQHRKEELTQRAGELSKASGTIVRAVLLKGAAAAKTVEYCESNADIIVLSTHGHTGWDHMMLGSVAEKIVRTSKIPVFTVHGLLPKESTQAPSTKTIMMPTDFSDHALAALPYAMELTKAFNAKLELVSVIHDKLHISSTSNSADSAWASWMLREHESATSKLKSQADEIRNRFNIEVTHAVLHGHPTSLLVQHAGTIKADCIVISTHGRSGLSNLLIGSVAIGVVRQSSCPVLSIRPAKTILKTVGALG